MKNDKYTQEEIDEQVKEFHETLLKLSKQEDRDEELVQQYLGLMSINLVHSINGDIETWVDRYKQFKDDQSKTAT